MRLSRLAAVALALGLVSGILRADETVTTEQLPFVPYSSDYQSPTVGALIRPQSGPVDFQEMLSSSVLGSRSEGLIYRFDRARAAQLGTTHAVSTEIRGEIERTDSLGELKGAFGWTGVCHQWSAAGLDPEIAGLLASTDGMVCEGALFSKGDLKELVTALYRYSGATQTGERNALDLPALEADIRLALGIAGDLSAEDFDRTLFDALRSGHGVVIDRDPGWMVWNHPVYRATASDRTIASPAGIAGRIPPHLLEGTGPGGEATLERIGTIDANLLATTDANLLRSDEINALYDRMTADFNHVRAELGAGDAAVPPLTGEEDFDALKRRFLSLRSWITAGPLSAGLRSGSIRMRPGTTVERRRTRVDYATEVPFGSPQEASDSRTYEYLLFRREGRVTESVWISPPAERPDFLWIPNDIDVAGLGPDEPDSRRRALRDLFALMSRCTGMREIVAYFAYVDEAASDNRITPGEWSRIEAGYARLRGNISRELLLAKLAPGGNALPGVDPGELAE